jgi:hypothetical protein
VLAVSLAVRLGLWLLYQPVAYSDTASYRRLAQAVLRGFERYDGTRTPGYPLILALFGPDERVWLAQMGMGVLVSLLLFYMGWQISGRAWFGGLAGLAHSLNLQQLLFEPNLLSETASTLWVILSVAGVVLWYYRPERRSPWLAAATGLAASLAWLTRPLFIYLPFWIFLFLVVSPGKRWKNFGWGGSVMGVKAEIEQQAAHPWPGAPLASLVAFLIPVVLCFGVWIGFIHERYNQWGLSTMTGYHMIQHTGEFFEYIPDEFAFGKRSRRCRKSRGGVFTICPGCWRASRCSSSGNTRTCISKMWSKAGGGSGAPRCTGRRRASPGRPGRRPCGA